MQYNVSFKERFYFGLMIALSLPIYCFFGAWIYGYQVPAEYILVFRFYEFYFGLVLFYIFFISPLFLKGYLIGNSIKITEKQFPEYDAIIKKQAALLNMPKPPFAYVVQSGGVLNAFATRLIGKNYIVLYSAILNKANDAGKDAVEFIIAHELGHIKRNHLSFFLNLLILPARIIPFLYKAYSRAREYTCDSIGVALAPLGAEKGMVLLAAGKDLQDDVDVDSLIESYQQDKGFSTWLFEICSIHPLMIKRIQRIRSLLKQQA
jgi:Zn-dependent protease with chaperone function